MVNVTEEVKIDPDQISEEVINTKPKHVSERQTQEELISALAEEMRRLLKGIKFPHADGRFKEMTVYEQLEPYHTDDDDDDDEMFPYCVVKFDTSRITDVSEREEVRVVIGLGLCYYGADRQYAHYYFHVFNLIRRRFIGDNFLHNFRCEPEMGFTLHPDDDKTYPYYVGAVTMKWMIPGVEREVDFWNK